jgi:DNA-binding IclR family transcriptional regulator
MVQVVIKAFDILELIAQAKGKSVTLTEISSILNLKQPTVSNIINTLISKGYVEHIGKKKGYKLVCHTGNLIFVRNESSHALV